MALSMKCSPEYRNYLWISEEKETLQFYVIAKPKLDLGVLSSNTSDFFNLQKIYVLLFSFVGYNILRKLFFGHTPMIWNKNIPNPDRIIVLLDAIEYARFEGDLVREELLFFTLMDIMRNIELLRGMTDSVFVKREELYHKGFTNE